MSLIFLPNLTNVGLTCWSEPITADLTSLSDPTNMDLICLSYQLKLESDIFNIIIHIINIIINKFEKILLLSKKTINLIWMIKLKIKNIFIIIIVNIIINKFKKYIITIEEKP
jgi:hypothetical protein